jgi:hypothetical protein
VPITVRHGIDGRYTAEVTPPHGGSRAWTTPTSVPLDDLIVALRERGCHQTDIGDALYQADPNWLSRGTREPPHDVVGRGIPSRSLGMERAP